MHSTIDGELVVCHDPSVDRTTQGLGDIATLGLAELRELDNAYWFVPGEDAVHGRDAGAYPLRGRAPAERELGVATLAEVLERFPGVVLNLDIKRTAPDVEPYEAALAEILREHGRRDDVIVASFLDSATERFAAIAPEIAISCGTVATAEFYRRVRAGESPQDDIGRFAALQVPTRVGDTVVVEEAFVAAAHTAGLAVHVWTVDDPSEMEHLVELGVDGIISDKPTVLAGVLDRLGVTWRP